VKISPPDYDERLLVLGSNGSGKSVLVRELLGAGYRRTISIDLKGDFVPLQDHRVVREPDDWRGWRARHVVYRPRPPYDSGAPLDQVLWRLYHQAQRTYDSKRKVQPAPFVVYVDETLALAHSRRTEGLARIAVAGRALGLGLWCASQRPRWIPVEARSEAHRVYVFYLQYEEDERELLKLAKRQLSLEDLQRGWDKWSFWELRRSRTSAGRWEVRHMPPLPEEVALR
jgi:energy-coupling factor transporter ATP-binding protein EcfA2